jgi:hypothetical protein
MIMAWWIGWGFVRHSKFYNGVLPSSLQNKSWIFKNLPSVQDAIDSADGGLGSMQSAGPVADKLIPFLLIFVALEGLAEVSKDEVAESPNGTPHDEEGRCHI